MGARVHWRSGQANERLNGSSFDGQVQVAPGCAERTKIGLRFQYKTKESSGSGIVAPPPELRQRRIDRRAESKVSVAGGKRGGNQARPAATSAPLCALGQRSKTNCPARVAAILLPSRAAASEQWEGPRSRAALSVDPLFLLWHSCQLCRHVIGSLSFGGRRAARPSR